ncbi:MAG: hypothetical protein HY875_09850 [Chloroflexi bacterium]|nr:hypothetical protein [Chloroflexota bacterium]
MDYPREVIFPMAAIQVPVTIISAGATAVLYLTVFRDEAVKAPGDLFGDGASGPLFAYLVLTAFEALFGQVARAATIFSVSRAVKGERIRLVNALDPAFTRMGGLLVVAILYGLVVAPVLSIFLFPIALYFALRFGLSFEAFVIDGVSPTAAMRTSWRVMRGNLLRFICLLALFVAVLVGPLILLSSLALVDAGSRGGNIAVTAVLTVLQGVVLIPFLSLFTAATTLFYLKARGPGDDRRTA